MDHRWITRYIITTTSPCLTPLKTIYFSFKTMNELMSALRNVVSNQTRICLFISVITLVRDALPCESPPVNSEHVL